MPPYSRLFPSVPGVFGVVMSQTFVPNICRITTSRGIGGELDGSSVCLVVICWGSVVAGARLPVQPSLVILGG